jgi:hypothetical protein
MSPRPPSKARKRVVAGMAQSNHHARTADDPGHDIDWRPLAATVAQRLSELGLIGTHNRRQSKATILRFNSQGSLAVDLTSKNAAAA